MMFKFSFDGNLGEEQVPFTQQNDCSEELPAKREPVSSAAFVKPSSPYDYLFLCNSAIKIRKSTASPSVHLSPSGADIIPYKYEGGYKLWEGAVDLVEYLFTEHADMFNGKRVLELGAGHALPSILAAQLGALHIDINDYNVEVLRDITMPNITANVRSQVTEIRFFSGGWRSLPQVLDAKYDIILSAETIYAAQQSEDLADCLLKTLADNGTAFIAAKSYYFGVGGGTRAFERHVQDSAIKQNKPLCTNIVHEIRNGVSNVRQILQIQRISSQDS